MTEQIAKRLKLLRAAHDLKAEDVAYEIGYNTNMLWRIEAGQSKPNIEFIARICRVYDVSIDELVYDSEQQFQARIKRIYSEVTVFESCDVV